MSWPPFYISIRLKWFNGHCNGLGDNFIGDSKVKTDAKLLDEQHCLIGATFKLESREDPDCSNRFQSLGFGNLPCALVIANEKCGALFLRLN